MPRDRLAELQRIRAQNQLDDTEIDLSDGAAGGDPPTYEQAVVIPMDRLDGMAGFFNQIEEVKKYIDEVKEEVDRVKKLHGAILAQPVPDERSKQELDQLMSTIKTSSSVVRAKLKEMERGVQKEEEEATQSGVVAAGLRMRKTQHSALLRQFIDIMTQYQAAQTDYRDRCKGRIKRHLEIVGSEFSDDEVEKMIEEGNFSVFTQGIIQQTEQAKQMLADIQARHSDILKLEKSIRELHELFVEMAILVESQGEVIDRIETHVTGAGEWVQEAREQLGQAVKLQTAARKKKICVVVTIIVVVIVVLLIILASTGAFK